MEWFEALILGLIQGLAEFLPISSSGHLLIGREILGVEAAEDTVFEVVVHAATVLSTIIVFRKQIWDLLKGFFAKRNLRTEFLNDETDYLLKIAVSMIPIFIVGMFFKDYVEALFSNLLVVGICLLVTALLLTFTDFFSEKIASRIDARGKKVRNSISWAQAAIVGIGQAIAVLPGLSRSGTTIATGLLCGVKREVMAQFSFLMVLIPILGEAFLDLVGGDLAASSVPALSLVCGFAASFLSGLFACRVMIALVKKAQLRWFGLYCLLMGLAVVCHVIFA